MDLLWRVVTLGALPQLRSLLLDHSHGAASEQGAHAFARGEPELSGFLGFLRHVATNDEVKLSGIK